ncbi:hypothetical protein ACSN7Q_001653 [Flavobacterium psychrophilum]
MNEIVNPYEELSQVIQNLEKELIDYEKSPKKVQFVVEKRKALINKLIEILDLITLFDTDNIITTLAHEIHKIRKKDTELDSLLIRIDYVPNGQKTGFIKIQSHK